MQRKVSCREALGSAVLELLEEEELYDVKVTRFGYPDHYIEQGEQPELRSEYGLDAAGIAAGIRKAMVLTPEYGWNTGRM